MTQTNGKFEVYEDFSGGDWGDIGKFRAAANQYDSHNVIVYADGMIGPRAGLHQFTSSGLPDDDIWGLFNPLLSGKSFMAVVGDKVYSSSTEIVDVWTLEATLDAEANDYVHADWYDPNHQIYFTNPGDKPYVIDWTSSVLAGLSIDDGTPVAVLSVTLCRDRLYFGGATVTDGQRVWYSALADFDNFTFTDGAGYFDVGYFWNIHGFAKFQNSLLFGTRAQGWFALIGSTPNGEVRQINSGVSPGKQHSIVATSTDAFFFTGFPGGGATSGPHLASTDGAKFDDVTLRHLRLDGPYAAEQFGVYLPYQDQIIYVANSGNRGLIRNMGAWTKQFFELGTTSLKGPLCATNTLNNAVLSARADAGGAPKFYNLRLNLNRPAFTSDTDCQPTDDGVFPIAASFSLPVWFHPQSKDIRVRRVIVDFRKWDTGVTNNNFTVGVSHYGRYNLPGGSTDDLVYQETAWTEAASLTLTTGQMDRYTYRVGDVGWAAGFQINIDDMIGVAVDRITVEYDESSQPGRPN